MSRATGKRSPTEGDHNGNRSTTDCRVIGQVPSSTFKIPARAARYLTLPLFSLCPSVSSTHSPLAYRKLGTPVTNELSFSQKLQHNHPLQVTRLARALPSVPLVHLSRVQPRPGSVRTTALPFRSVLANSHSPYILRPQIIASDPREVYT